MPDKKLTDVTDNNVAEMTDNEIKKALECCLIRAEFSWCENKGVCPYFDKGETYSECKKLLFKDTLDLINRLQAEIEQWRKNCDDLYKEMSERLRAELKIERKLAKAEAYKECIEKVKEYIDTYEHLACEECECVPISKETLDNILKEKVGD